VSWMTFNHLEVRLHVFVALFSGPIFAGPCGVISKLKPYARRISLCFRLSTAEDVMRHRASFGPHSWSPRPSRWRASKPSA